MRPYVYRGSGSSSAESAMFHRHVSTVDETKTLDLVRALMFFG